MSSLDKAAFPDFLVADDTGGIGAVCAVSDSTKTHDDHCAVLEAEMNSCILEALRRIDTPSENVICELCYCGSFKVIAFHRHLRDDRAALAIICKSSWTWFRYASFDQGELMLSLCATPLTTSAQLLLALVIPSLCGTRRKIDRDLVL